MKLKDWNCLSCFSFLLVLVLHSSSGFAQHSFMESGEIEFEKNVNIFAKLKNRAKINSAISSKFVEEYRNTQPQFYKGKGVLYFSKEASIYTTPEVGQVTALVGNEPWVMIKNEIRHDFTNDSISALKKVYGELFLIRDKTERIKWKLTNEVREIAGYSCKRANGIMLDSVYVVAFYSEEILPSAGPESFSGLPGMILGVALPHENVSWFATRVAKAAERSELGLKVPAAEKVKAISRNEYKSILQKSMKDWGNLRWEALKAFLL